MDFESSWNGAVLTVSVEGEIDEFSSRSLRSELDGLIERRRPRCSKRWICPRCLSWTARGWGLYSADTRNWTLAGVNSRFASPRQVDKGVRQSGVYSFVEKQMSKSNRMKMYIPACGKKRKFRTQRHSGLRGGLLADPERDRRYKKPPFRSRYECRSARVRRRKSR